VKCIYVSSLLSATRQVVGFPKPHVEIMNKENYGIKMVIVDIA